MEGYKKLHNPFNTTKGDDYYCFGCSPTNNLGLHLEFYSDGDEIVGEWMPKRTFEGFKNVVHGGIQATIMDEVASWAIYALVGTAGVTQKLEVNYLKPLFMSKGKVTNRCKVSKADEKQAILFVELLDGKGVVCSNGYVDYYLFPLRIAQLKYAYPGKDAFWSE